MRHSAQCSLALPPGYRSAEVLAFHARDTSALAERVQGSEIRKGVLFNGVALLLRVRLQADVAHCQIEADGDLDDALLARAQEALRSMLALRLDPGAFAVQVAADPWLAPLVARLPGLRVVQSASIFEALTWAIIGQQINVSFAISLRHTLISLAGHAHSSGLWCYPEATDVARLAVEEMTSRKFSRAKAETLLRVARLVEDGSLRLALDDDPLTASSALLAIKGIGPWTVNYTLLRGYGAADCSLEGDVAVRKALGRLLDRPSMPTQAETQHWLAAYRPNRSMAAVYLWASLQPA